MTLDVGWDDLVWPRTRSEECCCRLGRGVGFLDMIVLLAAGVGVCVLGLLLAIRLFFGIPIHFRDLQFRQCAV